MHSGDLQVQEPAHMQTSRLAHVANAAYWLTRAADSSAASLTYEPRTSHPVIWHGTSREGPFWASPPCILQPMDNTCCATNSIVLSLGFPYGRFLGWVCSRNCMLVTSFQPRRGGMEYLQGTLRGLLYAEARPEHIDTLTGGLRRPFPSQRRPGSSRTSIACRNPGRQS